MSSVTMCGSILLSITLLFVIQVDSLNYNKYVRQANDESEGCKIVTAFALEKRELMRSKIGVGAKYWRPQHNYETVRALVKSHTSGIDISDDAQVQAMACKLVTVTTLTEATNVIGLKGVQRDDVERAYSQYVDFLLGLKIDGSWEIADKTLDFYDYIIDLSKSKNLSIRVDYIWEGQKDRPLVVSNFLEQLQTHFTKNELEDVLADIVDRFGSDIMDTLAKLWQDPDSDYFLGRTLSNDWLGEVAQAFMESNTVEELAEYLNIPVPAAIGLTRHIPVILTNTHMVGHSRHAVQNGKSLEEHSNLLNLQF